MSDTNVSKYLSSYDQIQANYEKYKEKFSDANADLVNSETFLNLLVAEMTNQDPLEPTSNTEFVTQMAQFTSLQYAQDSSTYAQANYAASLVGKTATASKMEGSEHIVETGVVDSVVKNGDSYTVSINGKNFDISKITSVEADKTESGSTGGTVNSTLALGDTIARASMMIGMYATVNAKTDKGSVVDAGVIDSIQVKNGEVNIVIGDIAYKLSDVVEVKYPEYEAPESDTTTEVPEVNNAPDVNTEDIATEIIEAIMADNQEIKDAIWDLEYDVEGLEEIVGELTGDIYQDEDIADLEEVAEERKEDI